MFDVPLTIAVPVAALTAAIVCTVLLARLVPDDATAPGRDAVGFGAALLLYGLFYAAFFLQSYIRPNYLAPSDSFDFGVSAYLSRPELWSNGIWSGYPVAADPQSLTWYPLLHLFRALGIHWNSFLISAYAIASASTFLFVRRLTRSTLAGAFAGFACGFNALMVGYVANFNQVHAFAWVPLALYGLQLIREGFTRAGTAATATGVALMWLAGHPQIPVYATYLGAAIVIAGLLLDHPTARDAFRRVFWSVTGLVLGLCLAAVLFVPMLELSRFSTRAEPTLERYGASAYQAFELLTTLSPFALGGFSIPDGYVEYIGVSLDSAYIGLVTIALALMSAFLPRGRREARVWLGLAVLEALLCLGPATIVGRLFYYAPGLANFQAPLRHLFLVSLCLSVAAGFSLAAIIRNRTLSNRLVVAAAVVSALALLATGLLTWIMPAATRVRADSAAYATWAFGWPLIVAAGVMLAAASVRFLPSRHGGAIVFAVLLVVVEVADLTAVHYRLPGRHFRYADVRQEEGAPAPRMAALRDELRQSGQRALAADGSKNAFLLPNFPRAWNIPSASGTGSLALQSYLAVMGMDTAGAVSPEALSDAHRGADLFAVRYALIRQDSEASAVVKAGTRWQVVEELRRDEDDPDTYYTLLRNTRALPPAWCASRVIPADRDATLAAIHTGTLPDGSAFDPRRDVLVDVGLQPSPYAEADAEAQVRFDATRPNRIDVNATSSCVLVMSEVAYPWWRASLDGRPAALFRIDDALIGVNVPPGSHTVELWLRPMSLWIGAVVSGLAVLGLAAMVLRRAPHRP